MNDGMGNSVFFICMGISAELYLNDRLPSLSRVIVVVKIIVVVASVVGIVGVQRGGDGVPLREGRVHLGGTE